MTQKIPFTDIGDQIVVIAAGDGLLAKPTGRIHITGRSTWEEVGHPAFKVRFEEFVPLRVGQVGRVVSYERYAEGIGLMGGGTGAAIVEFDNNVFIGFWRCDGQCAKEENYIQWVERAASFKVATVLDLLADV